MSDRPISNFSQPVLSPLTCPRSEQNYGAFYEPKYPRLPGTQ
jgi:hypothetical protein